MALGSQIMQLTVYNYNTNKLRLNLIHTNARGEGLMKHVIQSRMEDRRPTARKRIGMLEEIKKGSFMIMKRRAERLGEIG